jgi:hypothetical protein
MQRHFASRRKLAQVGKVIGKEAALNAIHAEIKVIPAGRGGDGVGPGLLLAGRVDSQEGNKLSGLKIKVFQLRNGKFKMETRCGF